MRFNTKEAVKNIILTAEAMRRCALNIEEHFSHLRACGEVLPDCCSGRPGFCPCGHNKVAIRGKDSTFHNTVLIFTQLATSSF